MKEKTNTNHREELNSKIDYTKSVIVSYILKAKQNKMLIAYSNNILSLFSGKEKLSNPFLCIPKEIVTIQHLALLQRVAPLKAVYELEPVPALPLEQEPCARSKHE